MQKNARFIRIYLWEEKFEMSAKQNATMYEMVPVVSELNKVEGFNPLKFLRVTKQGIKNLDLRYKKLWFRLKYPAGRIKSFTVRVTEQIAIIEARVYFDKNDKQPRASFIAQREKDTTPGGLYIEAAQHAAIDQALSDAGFGVQFVPCNAEQCDEVVDTTVQTVVKQPEAIAEVVQSPELNASKQVMETQPEVVAETVEEVVEEMVAVAPAEVVAEPVAETQQTTEVVAETATEVVEATNIAKATETVVAEPEGEEVAADELEQSVGTAKYTKDMPVEEICKIMTLGEAGDVIVPIGSCKDWTLSQVADRRPASLKWYIHGYDGDDNILRAAATLIRAAYEEKMAS